MSFILQKKKLAEPTPMSPHNRVTINISGKIFETHQTTLDRFPKTLLSSDNPRRHEFYCIKTRYYYFNRDRKTFESILFFYQSSGKLYLPTACSLDHFVKECEFFQLPKHSIEFLKMLEGAQLMKDVKAASKKVQTRPATSFTEHWQNFLDYPTSSNSAMFYFILHSVLIIVSISKFCLETLPYIEHFHSESISHPWMILEIFTCVFFLVDLMLRYTFSKEKSRFFCSLFTVIDFITIPTYSVVDLLVPMNDDGGNARFLKAIQFLRIVRFLRFGKISRRVSIIYVIVGDSLRDLQYFFICLLVVVTTSGSIVYLMEKSEVSTGFRSIPDSMWWSLQAYLTIGYGDVIPRTLQGRLFSAVYMIVGILTLMLPMLSLILKLVKCTKEINLDGHSGDYDDED